MTPEQFRSLIVAIADLLIFGAITIWLLRKAATETAPTKARRLWLAAIAVGILACLRVAYDVHKLAGVW